MSDPLHGAIVARLVMLQSEMRHVIAERQQEMIVAIVPRAEQRAGLLDQVLRVRAFHPA